MGPSLPSIKLYGLMGVGALRGPTLLFERGFQCRHTAIRFAVYQEGLAGLAAGVEPVEQSVWSACAENPLIVHFLAATLIDSPTRRM